MKWALVFIFLAAGDHEVTPVTTAYEAVSLSECQRAATLLAPSYVERRPGWTYTGRSACVPVAHLRQYLSRYGLSI
jgi:hypothetical protein